MSVRVPIRLWLFALVGCLVAGALDVFQSILKDEVAWQVLAFRGLRWIPLGAVAPLTYYLGQRWPLQSPRLGRALFVHAVGALLLSIGWPAISVVIRRTLHVWAGAEGPLGQDLAAWTLTALPWSFLMYFTVLGCVHAFGYHAEAREREAQAARLQGQLSEARLDALRMQLQPHFLFNILNSILVLVRDHDTSTAARMLELLSNMMREVLRSDQAHESSLDEELSLIGLYLGLEQVRFSDRLQIEYAVPDELRAAAVPRFILQPLVENAIRHSTGDTDQTIVEIGAAHRGPDLELWVQDNGPGPSARPRVGGVGLENTRLRLTTLYGELAAVELGAASPGGTIARVRLPYHLFSRA